MRPIGRHPENGLEQICELNSKLCVPMWPTPSCGRATVIDIRRRQRKCGDGFIRETVAELWEGWMGHTDAILADEELLETIYHALQKRHPRSRTHGRPGTPAEVVMHFSCSG